MQAAPAQLNSWREGVYVTRATAAEILGYSVASVRRLIFCEALNAVRLARGGPTLVTVESLLKFAAEAEPLSHADISRMAKCPPVKLTLVVNNQRK